MGDSSLVHPLNGSPLRYIASVSYEKGWQSLKPIVSVYKKIKLPPIFGGPTLGYLQENDSIWWHVLSGVPACCLFSAFINLVVDPGFFIFITVTMVGGIGHLISMYSIIYWHRDMPFQLIGAKPKFLIEVIPTISAAALHHLLEFNRGYLALLLSCTIYFYSIAHFMHITYDIGIVDVLLGIVMQILAYVLNADLLVRVLVLSLYFGLCSYRYMTYCAPEPPAHRKKELKRPLI